MLTPLICVVVALIAQQSYFEMMVRAADPVGWSRSGAIWGAYLVLIWLGGRLAGRRVAQDRQLAATAVLDVLAVALFIVALPEAWRLTRGAHDLSLRAVRSLVPADSAELISHPEFLATWAGLLPFLIALVLIRRREATGQTTASAVRFLGLILLPYFVGSMILETAFWDVAAIHLLGRIPNWQAHMDAWHLHWPLTCFVIVTLLVLLPTLALTVIRTRPLPAGSMREMLTSQATSQDVRYHELRLWDAGPGVVNAAVMGTLPMTRSLLITEGMIDRFTPDEIRLVFWHELGHITQRHLPIQGAFFVTVPGLALFAENWLPQPTWPWLPSAVMLAFWVTGFTWLSRTLEKHADLYAMRHAGDGRLYIDVLRRLGVVTGVSPAFKSLTHGSLNQRIEFLTSMIRTPQMEHRFQKKIRLIRRALGVVLCAEIAFWITLLATS